MIYRGLAFVGATFGSLMEASRAQPWASLSSRQKPSRKVASLKTCRHGDPLSTQKRFEALLEGLAVPPGAEKGPPERTDLPPMCRAGFRGQPPWAPGHDLVRDQHATPAKTIGPAMRLLHKPRRPLSPSNAWQSDALNHRQAHGFCGRHHIMQQPTIPRKRSP